MVRVLDIHVIEDEQGVRRSGGEAPDIGQGRHAPRRIVRRHDRDDGRERVEPAYERFDGEGLVPPRDADQLTARERGAAVEHVEAGIGEEDGTAGLEEGAARAVDSLVRAGGHHQALGRHADAGGERGLECGDVWVAAQQLWIRVGKIAQQGGGRQNSLVRVEAQQARNARRTAISGGRVDPRHGTVQGRGSGRHGTICEKVDTTRSVPPAAFTAGITSGSASRGTAAFTA